MTSTQSKSVSAAKRRTSSSESSGRIAVTKPSVMNRLNSQQNDQGNWDLTRRPPDSCPMADAATLDDAPTVRVDAAGRASSTAEFAPTGVAISQLHRSATLTGEELVSRLEQCESSRIAEESAVVWFVSVVFLVPWLFAFRGIVGFALVLVFGFWLVLRRRRNAARERELCQLLDQLQFLVSKDAKATTAALPALRMLSLPTAAEPRTTRERARNLYRCIHAAQRESLPIAADPHCRSTADLPVSYPSSVE